MVKNFTVMPKSLTGANEKLQHSLSTRKIKSTNCAKQFVNLKTEWLQKINNIVYDEIKLRICEAIYFGSLNGLLNDNQIYKKDLLKIAIVEETPPQKNLIGRAG